MGDLAIRASLAEILDALAEQRMTDQQRADVMLRLMRAFRLVREQQAAAK